MTGKVVFEIPRPSPISTVTIVPEQFPILRCLLYLDVPVRFSSVMEKGEMGEIKKTKSRDNCGGGQKIHSDYGESPGQES